MMVAELMAASWQAAIVPPGSGSPGLDGMGTPCAVWKANPVPVVVMTMFLSWTMRWWALQSETRLLSFVSPPLAQYRMWWASVRRDSQPGNRQRQRSRSRTAQRGRRLAGAAAGVQHVPGHVVEHGADGGVAGDQPQGGGADGAAVLEVAAQREGRVGGVRVGVRAGGHFRGNATAVTVVMVVVVVVGVLEVVAGRPQRLQEHRRAVGGQHAPEHEHVIVGPSPGQAALLPGVRVLGGGDAAVGAGEPLELPGGHRHRHGRQVPLGLRGGDPGEGPDLRIRQPGGGELGPDDRQVRQGPGDPDLLAGGPWRDLAFPRQPGRARGHLPRRPPFPRIEIRDQQQEPARRRRQVPRKLADPRLQMLSRHGRRIRRAKSRAGIDGNLFIAHRFDYKSGV